MRRRNTILLVGICVAILFGGAAIGAEVIDRILAVVDEDIILESEVHQYLQFNLAQEVDLRDLNEAQLYDLKMEVLEELIRQKVLLAKARADTVTIPDRELDRELDNRLKT
ncbi:SurA N-terminal domain-containing protein, partial [bacterium]|nr:SurA N-terminal domain-containing protein [bacterium]